MVMGKARSPGEEELMEGETRETLRHRHLQ